MDHDNQVSFVALWKQETMKGNGSVLAWSASFPVSAWAIFSKYQKLKKKKAAKLITDGSDAFGEQSEACSS